MLKLKSIRIITSGFIHVTSFMKGLPLGDRVVVVYIEKGEIKLEFFKRYK